MTLVANIYPDSRSSVRMLAARFATIRDEDENPFDVLIEDLSKDGFSMSTAANFAVGTVVSLRLSKTLKRRVRVVRRLGLVYGCEFLVPLSGTNMASAVQGGGAPVGILGLDEATGDAARDFRRGNRRLSNLARAYILFGMVVMLWAVIIVGASNFF